jgi:hypothetical protein
MRYGKIDLNHSETGNGQKLVNVKNVEIIKIVRGMDFITGMEIRRMF